MVRVVPAHAHQSTQERRAKYKRRYERYTYLYTQHINIVTISIHMNIYIFE